MTPDGLFVTIADQPFEVHGGGCVFVDPAGMFYILHGPKNAKGASGRIYEETGISKLEAFPDDVVQGITKPGDAKYHKYVKKKKKKKSGGAADLDSEEEVEVWHVIHVVGPNFCKDFEPGVKYTREQAVKALAEAYCSILREFLASGQRMLRLLPVSGGFFAGHHEHDFANLTFEALQAGFELLELKEKLALAATSLGMCIFAEEEHVPFFNAGFPTVEAAATAVVTAAEEAAIEAATALTSKPPSSSLKSKLLPPPSSSSVAAACFPAVSSGERLAPLTLPASSSAAAAASAAAEAATASPFFFSSFAAAAASANLSPLPPGVTRTRGESGRGPRFGELTPPPPPLQLARTVFTAPSFPFSSTFAEVRNSLSFLF
jgi:hypothetical protein